MSDNFQTMARLLSIQDAGWIEAGDSRVFLCDAVGGFYTLREQIAREIGAEFQSDIFYRAGFAATDHIIQHCISHGYLDSSEEGLTKALGLLSGAGYGAFRCSECEFESGWAVVSCHNAMEAWSIRRNGGRAGFSCDYTRGLLRGVMHYLLTARGLTAEAIECTEVSCVANGDPECRFIIGTDSELVSHGYRTGGAEYTSVRETLLRLNRQMEEVLEAAQKDSLTGLYNRAYFESVLRRRIEFASRSTDTLAVALIDVDRFKEVNDTMGHGMGDLALKQIARVLSSQGRETDLIARYGGDEFAWLMPGTGLDAARVVAERIRGLVEAQNIAEIPLTLSIGLALCPSDSTGPAALLHCADEAMYAVKGRGGNGVEDYAALRESGAVAPILPAEEDASSPSPTRRRGPIERPSTRKPNPGAKRRHR